MSRSSEKNATLAVMVFMLFGVGMFLAGYLLGTGNEHGDKTVKSTPFANQGAPVVAWGKGYQIDTTKEIAEMKVGERGYTTPWTMLVYRHHPPQLVGTGTVERQPEGTVSMLVKKTAHGFLVGVPRGYRFDFENDFAMKSDKPQPVLSVTKLSSCYNPDCSDD